jgi:2-methylisocitrate lyase-like PEP mutase family enzyme
VLVAVRSVSSTLVREIEGPLNVVMGLGTAEGNARELLGAGVQRISLGGSIARSALGFVRRCAQELRDAGSITFATGQIPPQPELNALFARARAMYVPGVTYDAARGVRGRSSQISAWPRG